jgi:EmrB/QacA subfamily drug resistance transporter
MYAVLHPLCDAAAAQSAGAEKTAVHPQLVLAGTILASSLAFIDGSVVNVGLPAIGRSLAANAAGLQWIINAYLLPLSALLLLGGTAGDRFGRRRLLVVGTALFASASLGCTLAPNLAALLASRAIQGVGAAILLPNSLALLGKTFSGPTKGRAVGVWAAAGAAAGAIGPVLGGWLIDLGSWRAIFLINLPLAAGAILLVLRFVAQDEIEESKPLDVLGGFLATIGVGALTWALTTGSGKSGWTQMTVVTGVAALTIMLLFTLVEKRRGDRAMMSLHLFASRIFVGLTLFTLLLYAALGGLFVLLPYVLIKAGGYSGAAAGAALLPLPLVISVTSPLIGDLASRVGPRLPLAIGSSVAAGGFLLALRIGDAGSYWVEVLPAILLIALGASAAVAPLTTAVLSSVDVRHTGSASGLNSAVARTGGLVATASLGVVLAAGGEQLWAAFHTAMLVGAATCAAAAMSALGLIRRATPGYAVSNARRGRRAPSR